MTIHETALPWPQTWREDDRLTRSSLFSYRCGFCSSCCRAKLIQVNPYEIAWLAAHLGISTTECIAEYLDGVYLRRHEDGTCIFLNEKGCRVHAARPLVCRLYPLGRHVDASGAESFGHVPPMPQTLGAYGEHSTVQDWIAAQGAQPFIDAVDAYLDLFHRLFKMIEEHEGSAQGVDDWPQNAGAASMPRWMDIDLTLTDRADATGAIDRRMRLHIRVLEKRFGLDAERSGRLPP